MNSVVYFVLFLKISSLLKASPIMENDQDGIDNFLSKNLIVERLPHLFVANVDSFNSDDENKQIIGDYLEHNLEVKQIMEKRDPPIEKVSILHKNYRKAKNCMENKRLCLFIG